MLKKGEKLTFAEAALSQEQMATALQDQADLSPEVLQALLEGRAIQIQVGPIHHTGCDQDGVLQSGCAPLLGI